MAEKRNEISRGVKEGPVNASEAGPGGCGLAEEPGKPGPRLVPVSLDGFLSEPGPRDGLVDLKQAQNTHTISFLPSDLEDVEFQESSPAEEAPVGSSDAPSQTRSHQPEGGPQPDGVFESS